MIGPGCRSPHPGCACRQPFLAHRYETPGNDINHGHHLTPDAVAGLRNAGSQFTCPYAMSAFVALMEKRISFAIRTLDLAGRSKQRLLDDMRRTSLTHRASTDPDRRRLPRFQNPRRSRSIWTTFTLIRRST